MAVVDVVLGAVSKLRHPEIRALYQELLAPLVSGKSVLDVGAMWGVNGACSFLAHDLGARAVTAVDITEDTAAFRDENARRGSPVRFVRGDLMDAGLVQTVGVHDVVFCAGVLYHLPDPLGGLQRLRALTRSSCILGSRSIPNGLVVNSRAIFYPGLSPLERFVAKGVERTQRVGVDSPFQAAASYDNWFWGLSPAAIAGLARTAGFVVDDVIYRPRGVVLRLSVPAA